MASAAGRPSTPASPATRAQASPPATAATAPPAAYTGFEQTLAVICSDSPNPRDPAAYPPAARGAYTRSGAFGPHKTWFLVACADWPAAYQRAARKTLSSSAIPGPEPWLQRTARAPLPRGDE